MALHQWSWADRNNQERVDLGDPNLVSKRHFRVHVQFVSALQSFHETQECAV